MKETKQCKLPKLIEPLQKLEIQQLDSRIIQYEHGLDASSGSRHYPN